MTIAKALVGAAIAGLGSLATALVDNGVTIVEWVGVITVTLAALYAVWRIPNTPAS